MNWANGQEVSARRILAVPHFRRLWVGQAISQIGDSLANLAIFILINRLTGSTEALAAMAIAIAMPQLLFGLIAGVWVDRWDRRRIMIVSDILRGLLVLGFIFIHKSSQVWMFYGLGFGQAAVGTFFNSAKGAIIPLLLNREMLLSANALSQSTCAVASVIGTVLAGILVSWMDSGWLVFTLDSITFFVSAMFIAQITVSKPTYRLITNAPFGQLVEGLRFVFGQRVLINVLVTFAVTTLGTGAVSVLFVPFLVNELKTPTNTIGFVGAFQVTGMVLGGMLITSLGVRLKVEWIIAGGVCGMGILIAAIGIAQSIWLVMIALLAIGLLIIPVQAAASTLLQNHVPDEKRGRTGSAVNTFITLAQVISMMFAGVLGSTLGVRPVFYLAGSVAAVAGIASIMLSKSTSKLEMMS